MRNLTIKPATLSESSRIIPLIMSATQDFYQLFIGKKYIRPFLMHTFKSNNPLLIWSHENILVARYKNNIIGTISVFSDKQLFYSTRNFLKIIVQLKLPVHATIQLIIKAILFQMFIATKLDRNCVYTESIAVQRDYQNKGIASRLITYGLKRARKRGYKKACLRVWSDNHNAIRLYTHLGYHIVAARNGKMVSALSKHPGLVKMEKSIR